MADQAETEEMMEIHNVTLSPADEYLIQNAKMIRIEDGDGNQLVASTDYMAIRAAFLCLIRPVFASNAIHDAQKANGR